MDILRKLDAPVDWWKLCLINAVGVIAMIGLVVVAYRITPVGDPTILSWLIIKKAIVMILTVLGVVDAATAMDWISDDNWWKALIEDKNVAVGIACAGLFVGVGLAIGAV